MSKSLKPPATYEQQVSKFESRGMTIGNRERVMQKLGCLNYYRLTGYAFHLLDDRDNYLSKTTFDLMHDLYCFDQKLRLILIESLEHVEVLIRTKIAYHFSHAFGTAGHYQADFFAFFKNHKEYIFSLEKAIEKNKDALFIKHHIKEYGCLLPLWVAFEILPFSILSKFYANIKSTNELDLQKEIAASINQKKYFLKSWLHSLSVLRNICAHYGRIYNREINPPLLLLDKFQKRNPGIKANSLFSYLFVIQALLPEPMQKKVLLTKIQSLIEEYIDSIDLRCIGFPSDWAAQFAAWKSNT